MPMFRSYGASASTRRSPNQISPPSARENPAISRRRVVLPQPEGPSSVNSSPSPTSAVARSTAATAPNRLTTSRSRIFTSPLWLLPDRFDVLAVALLELVAPLLGHVLVVDVGDGRVEIGADAARELHGHLDLGSRRSLHPVLRTDGEEPALHEDALAPLGQEELDEGPRGLGVPGAGQDGHGLGRDEG